jgi:hypothetical protein
VLATPLLTEKAVAVVARVMVRREERGAMVKVLDGGVGFLTCFLTRC